VHLGLLGGSFDPIHHGHLLAARALREALDLDEVRLIPAGTQPFKAGRHGASAAERGRMVELAIAGEPGLVLDRQELERPGPSYTVETLEAYRTEWPEARLVFLLGSDAAGEFHSWRRPERIRQLADVVIFRRDNETPPAGFRVVPVPCVAISASDIRERVRAGRSIRYLVPEAVMEYILERKLYAI
jgi:nicotinate-nucleotide adenylyltransferase